IAHKERGVHALARPLGAVLAVVVRAALAGEGAGERTPVALVPVPSRAKAVRVRGHDATATMTRMAARRLSGSLPVTIVAPVLRLRPGVVDQAGLSSAQRADNLDGSMAVDGVALRRLIRRYRRAHLVVCDDVVTTGATLGEAQRALATVGIEILASACVATTRPRSV
ncbi:MAG: ComF family protein, partial [Nocardioidaceae bacterium]|nr:ComF family protein [Nocardioidaceae bacterium]